MLVLDNVMWLYPNTNNDLYGSILIFSMDLNKASISKININYILVK